MPRTTASLACCIAVTAAAQDVDPSALVIALQSDDTRAVARARLLDLGARAVPALIERLADTSEGVFDLRLAILREIGPAAGVAVPELVRQAENQPRCTTAWLSTLAELVPFRPVDLDVDSEAIMRAFVGRLDRGLQFDESLALQRWTLRASFRRTLDTAALAEIARGIQPLRIEVAVDLLGARGALATSALPALRDLLARPEPRILGSDRRLPLHCKTAKAVLAITSSGDLAALARSVLQGGYSPGAVKPARVPERLLRRIDELVSDLAHASRRMQAIDNLVALGEVAVEPTGAALTATTDTETMVAALAVLRRLGARAAVAVPYLLEVLRRMPAEHTVEVIEALTLAAPWSRDHVPPLEYTGGVGVLTLLGVRIRGDIGVAFWNAFQDAIEANQVAMAVDPSMPVVELAQMLEHPWVRIRERTLVVAAGRGEECRPMLGQLEAMLQATQPRCFTLRVEESRRHVSRSIDRTAEVRRLAAQAIIAIAPPDDARVAAARALLAKPDPR
ncbi:MAG TPA: hypothetical protein VFZ65_21495 [Planctomycetota bacterium]|nr:hypothetical protein [Planctomycetota bacterium]